MVLKNNNISRITKTLLGKRIYYPIHQVIIDKINNKIDKCLRNTNINYYTTIRQQDHPNGSGIFFICELDFSNIENGINPEEISDQIENILALHIKVK